MDGDKVSSFKRGGSVYESSISVDLVIKALSIGEFVELDSEPEMPRYFVKRGVFLSGGYIEYFNGQTINYDRNGNRRDDFWIEPTWKELQELI